MRIYVIAVAAAGMLATAAAPRAAGTAIPTQDTFRDGYVIDQADQFAGWADRLRSDSGVPGVSQAYRDGSECVRSDVSGGTLFVRTARSACAPYTRAVTVDFTEPVFLSAGIDCSTGEFLVTDAYGGSGTLNLCGSNLIPDARIIASSLFARSSANGTPLTLVLNLAPDFQHNQFELEFQQNLPITVVSPSTRVLTGSSLSIANLYRSSGTKKRSLLGQYRMPFQLTVQLQ